jgi:hypothetical protein
MNMHLDYIYIHQTQMTSLVDHLKANSTCIYHHN